MRCRNCGVDLVRGFTFCMECGLPVPPEALEESGLPQRNIDSGVQETFGSENGGAPSAGADREQPVREEEITELAPVLHGGSDFTQGEELAPALHGGSDYTQGEELKPELRGGSSDEDNGAALKAQYVGGTPDDSAGKGADVQAVMREGSADDGDTAVEKLVFCPNCGMHMQKNPTKCEMCGMALGNMPTSSVPKTSSGIPLFNTDSDSFGGFGGFGDLGGFGGLTDEDAERIDNFMNPDPLFGNNIPTINAQATPDDFAQLTEQLASFSAAPTLDVTQNTVVRQQSTKQGEDFQLRDFQLSDDLSDVVIPIYDNKVHVVEDFSMEEDPDNPLPDPFAFLQTSLDEPAEIPAAEPIQEPAPISMPEPVPVQKPESVSETVPVSAPEAPPVSSAETVHAEEETEAPPFIEEVAPVIAETPAPKPPVLTDIGEPAKPPKSEAPKSEAPKLEPIKQTAPAAPQAPVAQAAAPATPTAPTAPEAAAAPKAPAAPSAPKTEEAPQQTAKTPPATWSCAACGREVLVGDKFCPNCGRSMYGGAPASSNNDKPAPKKKPVALIIVLVIVIIAAAAFFFLNRNGVFASELVTNDAASLFVLEE